MSSTNFSRVFFKCARCDHLRTLSGNDEVLHAVCITVTFPLCVVGAFRGTACRLQRFNSQPSLLSSCKDRLMRDIRLACTLTGLTVEVVASVARGSAHYVQSVFIWYSL